MNRVIVKQPTVKKTLTYLDIARYFIPNINPLEYRLIEKDFEAQVNVLGLQLKNRIDNLQKQKVRKP
jgi:hypothetical protein